VVNLLDISGSMNAGFGATSKLQAAKSALTSFNSNMQPSLGDQVGLAVFPLNNGSGYINGSPYNYNCTQHDNNYTAYYFGQIVSNLTNNITGVNNTINALNANGGTPTASGLYYARQAVLGTGHQSGHAEVIILASDGLANILLNGQWTGFQGNTYSSVSCNSQAEQDAIAQANIAKGDGNNDGFPDVTIFSIAVGTDFNPALLQAIASTDTDPNKPHYFTATDATSMASIYQQIASQVQTLSGDCTVIDSEAFAPNTTVAVRFPNGSVQNFTTSNLGSFVIPNAPDGNYQITGASVTINNLTYNSPTDGVGGPQISWPINVTVGADSVSYKTDFALKTTTPITCSQ
jgi:hypothetical protein